MQDTDRLRQVIDSIVGALDEPTDGPAMASRALLSRFHFDRVVAAGIGETPTAFRRRLLLERAAWQLLQGASVTDAAWGAGFDSVEGFSRAFSRLFGLSPGRFATSSMDFRLVAPNGVHFHPPGNLDVRVADARGAGRGRPAPVSAPVDRLTGPLGILVSHDQAMTDDLIDAASRIRDRLDVEVRPGLVVLDFDGPEPTVRSMLEHLVWTKEVWTAAIDGRVLPTDRADDIESLRRRHRDAGDRFVQLVAELDDGDRWGDAFIDTLCEPPQAFAHEAVVAHVLTFASCRRRTVHEVLVDLGAMPSTSSCPIEWDRARLSPHPLGDDALRGAGEVG